MAVKLPSASTTITPSASARAAGVDLITIIAAVSSNADGIPRLYSDAKEIGDFHGFNDGQEYAALHIERTGKPVLFVGVAVGTAGFISQEDDRGNSDTSVTTLSGTPLGDHDGVVKVKTGGTIGTDQIVLQVSLDGGTTFKEVKLGTGNSYLIPYSGVTISFAAGDLTADETIHTWKATGPKVAAAGLLAARTGLANQLKQSRSWMLIGDMTDVTEGQALVTHANAYETANDRFIYARASVYDKRSGKVSSKAGNLVFADVDDTITRDTGSWIDDGFQVGDSVDIANTVSNDQTTTVVTVTALVLTVTSAALADETIASATATVESTQTKAAHVAEADAEFEAVSAERRVDFGFGRARIFSPYTSYYMRRPAAWHISLREYQHDVMVPTWAKELGPLSGVSLEDSDGQLVEHDERVDGGALAAGFSCLRTWGNGPAGTFVARSITREDPNVVLVNTHQMAVANVACQVNQTETEYAVGVNLVLNASGNATPDSLARIKQRVDSALKRTLLQDNAGEGPRASNAYWTPSTDDDFTVADPVLTGVLTLLLLGTIVEINTQVRVNPTGG